MCSAEVTVNTYIITFLLEVNTSPSKSGELIVRVLLNQSCTRCWVDLIFTIRQFNSPWLTLPWGGRRDLMFPPAGGAITSEIITGIPAGIICLQPKLMLYKCLAQGLCPRASACCHNLAHIVLKKRKVRTTQMLLYFSSWQIFGLEMLAGWHTNTYGWAK